MTKIAPLMWVLLLCLASVAVAGQEAPAGVLKRLLMLNHEGAIESAEARQLLTGEALERWRSPTLGELAPKPDKIVLVRDDYAVARVELVSEQAVVPDAYFYLVREGREWKIQAMRSSSQLDTLNMLRVLAERSPPPDWEQNRREIDLTLSSDRELRSWFSENREALQTLVSQSDDEVAESARELGLNRVERADGEQVRIVIGGIQDNTVGFLYSPAAPAPPMSPDRFIWIEPLGDGWYLYRTT